MDPNLANFNSEMKNFTNNILRLLGIKHRKLYSVSLS